MVERNRHWWALAAALASAFSFAACVRWPNALPAGWSWLYLLTYVAGWVGGWRLLRRCRMEKWPSLLALFLLILETLPVLGAALLWLAFALDNGPGFSFG